jgi:hypothetical protein
MALGSLNPHLSQIWWVFLLRGCLKSRDFTNRSSMRLNAIGSITRDVWTWPS